VAMKDPNPPLGGAVQAPARGRDRSQHRVARSGSAPLAESFAKWIVSRQPLVTLKSALTLDGQLVLPYARGRARPPLRARPALAARH